MPLTQVQGQMLSGSNNTTTTIQSNGTTAITIDTSQNVGIGLTPFANTLSKSLDLVNGAGAFGYSNGAYFTQNAYYDGAWKYKATAAASAIFMEAGSIKFNYAASGTAGASFSPIESMRIDSSGSVGIGTTPSAWSGSGAKVLQNDRLSLAGISGNSYFSNNWYTDGAANRYIATAPAQQIRMADDTMIFNRAASGTAGASFSWSESMRIDSSGNLLVGTTSNNFASGAGGIILSTGRGLFTASGNPGLAVSRLTNTGNLCDWYYGNSYLGSVSTNGSTITYGGTSDYRLKENVKPLTGGLNKVMQMKPCSFVWKNTSIKDDGFLAHELAEVCPNAVVGEKDAVNEDGSINPQQIDTSFLVATLTAAIQEQQAMIEELKVEVQALKAK
jgi:hypothetical protein